MMKIPAFFLTCIIFLFSTYAVADSRWDAQVVDLITRAHLHADTLDGRIDYLTAEFVKAQSPYIAEPLGEGPGGFYSQRPLYRLDGFDCTTFVETVLALATTPVNNDHNKTLNDFQNKINAVRYKNADISFHTRNHFIEADWIPNNIAAGYVKDISHQVGITLGSPPHDLPIFINKKSWYAHLTMNRIFLPHDDLKVREQRLALLRASGKDIANSSTHLAYIPLSQLQSVNQIPNGTILQLVKPLYHAKDKIGTLVYISHQGIVIHKDNEVWLRHPSNRQGKVVEELLQDYLNQYQNSPWCKMHRRNCLRGVNLLEAQY